MGQVGVRPSRSHYFDNHRPNSVYSPKVSDDRGEKFLRGLGGEGEEMSEIKDSVNAFPISSITLRDYFASKAMEGLIIKWSLQKSGEFVYADPDLCSSMAYKFADAMLNEREKK